MTTTKCCLLGPMLLLPIFLSITALMLTWFSTLDCRLFQITHVGFENSTPTTVGLFTIQDYLVYNGTDNVAGFDDDPFATTTNGNDDFLTNGTASAADGLLGTDGDATNNNSSFLTGNCVGWEVHSTLDKSAIDAPLRFARIVSLFLIITAWTLPITLMSASCMKFPTSFLRIMSGVFILTGVLTLLSLTALATNVCRDAPSCSIGRDTIICGCACVLWAVTGAATLFLDKFQNAKEDDDTSDSSPTPAQKDATKPQAAVEPQDVPKPPTEQTSSGEDPTTPTVAVVPSEENNITEC